MHSSQRPQSFWRWGRGGVPTPWARVGGAQRAAPPELESGQSQTRIGHWGRDPAREASGHGRGLDRDCRAVAAVPRLSVSALRSVSSRRRIRRAGRSNRRRPAASVQTEAATVPVAAAPAAPAPVTEVTIGPEPVRPPSRAPPTRKGGPEAPLGARRASAPPEVLSSARSCSTAGQSRPTVHTPRER